MSSTEVREMREIEVGTSCSCTYCPNCSLGTNGWDACEECGGEVTYSSECYDCQPFDWAAEEFDAWVDRIGAKRLRIDGRAMGWQRRSGYSYCEITWKSFLDKISFNGDWTLKLKFDGDSFTFVRYSHDEPTGASFEVSAHFFLRDTMTLDEAIEHEIVDEYGCHISCGSYFEDCECSS